MAFVGDLLRLIPLAGIPGVVWAHVESVTISNDPNRSKTQMVVLGQPVVKPHCSEIIAENKNRNTPKRPFTKNMASPTSGDWQCKHSAEVHARQKRPLAHLVRK